MNWLFDGNGNPTTYSGSNLTFDIEDRLVSIASPAFAAAYAPDDRRASKTVSGTTTYYLYDEDGGAAPLLEEQGSSVSMGYGMAADGLRARYAPASGGLYYLFQWDPQGSLVQRQTGGPGGNTTSYALDTALFDGYGVKLSDTDTYTGGAEQPNRDAMGFQGQFGAYTDTETGLVLMGHRYYDAGTGRFLTRDPLGYGGGINLYGFTGNNPVNEMDPDGTDSAAAGEWIDRHWLRGLISKWAWSQGMADAGRNSPLQVAQHASNAINAVGDAIVLVAVPETEAADTEVVAGEKSGTITVYRVEGRINRHIAIDSSGGVKISEGSTLFLNFGNQERAEEFYVRRVRQGMKGVQLKSFEVPTSYAGDLSTEAVLEHEAHLFPDRPLRVDVRYPGQFGLRANHIEQLRKSIVPGSGKVLR